MPARKKTRKKIASANAGRKPSTGGTTTKSKKRSAKGGATQARSTKSRKTEIGAGATAVVEPQPSSRARKILVTATKVALSTRSRARRMVQKAGEYLSKPGHQVQQAIAMASEIPDKLKSYRKRSKSKKENT